VDSFNVPHYRPFEGEVRAIIEDEGSFNVDKLETFEVDWDPSDNQDFVISGQNVAKWFRAGTEPMLASGYSFWTNGNGQLICQVCPPCGRASMPGKNDRYIFSAM
jgi:hypothetical protein